MKTLFAEGWVYGYRTRGQDEFYTVKDVYLNFNNKWKKYVSECLST